MRTYTLPATVEQARRDWLRFAREMRAIERSAAALKRRGRSVDALRDQWLVRRGQQITLEAAFEEQVCHRCEQTDGQFCDRHPLG